MSDNPTYIKIIHRQQPAGLKPTESKTSLLNWVRQAKKISDEGHLIDETTKRSYDMAMVDLAQEPATKADIENINQKLSVMQWIIPVLVATNGVLVLVGISVVGTLIFKMFEN